MPFRTFGEFAAHCLFDETSQYNRPEALWVREVGEQSRRPNRVASAAEIKQIAVQKGQCLAPCQLLAQDTPLGRSIHNQLHIVLGRIGHNAPQLVPDRRHHDQRGTTVARNDQMWAVAKFGRRLLTDFVAADR